MRSLSEANVAAQAEGTEVSTKFRRTARIAIRAIYSVVIVIGLSSTISGSIKTHQKPISPPHGAVLQTPKTGASVANSQQSELKFDIPWHGRVEFDPVPGKYPEISGFGKFSSHAVREDDTECSSLEPDCVNGPIWKKYYVTNDEESGKTVTVTVRFK